MPGANSTSSTLALMNTTELSSLIDNLLEQYLSLLNTYTTLRVDLSNSQISIQQHLARANFHAHRGIRYGADCYDERMQASRVCSVTLTPEASSMSNPVPAVYAVSAIAPSASFSSLDVNEITTKIEGETSPIGEDTTPRGENTSHKEENLSSTKEKKKETIPDPIRMFGFTTPRELKVAQRESVVVIEDILPRLASVDSQMKALEIAVRRARKYRAKAEVCKSDDIHTS